MEERFLIAGDGPLRAHLDATAQREGCGNVEFPGYVEKERLFDLVRGAAFAVTPAVWCENSPYNIVESFAPGKPVIGSRIGGIPELAVDGETGILVPPDDEGALAEAMNRLAGDPSLTLELGRNARRKVETGFNAQVHYDRPAQVYAGLTG
ncbi:MAG: glycosyltransferase family 4 protein [bacterium]|jgi:glycosyltransferase involved in cell wall biosynthesis